MNIDELRQLSDWYLLHYSELNSLYGGLLSPIQHNASQPSKQPVESQLELLLAYLREMKFDELSLQQLRMLSSLGVDSYVGSEGAVFVDAAIRTSEFDPATAASKISGAQNKLNQAHSAFSSYLASLKSLGLEQSAVDKESDSITIRVGFQNDASINNVTDWKESAKDWYDIIRGLALASSEAPEDTKVVGASTGSIILILAGTLPVTTLLALISKNIASVAKDVIGIGNQIEDLRHKKLLNSVIENELKKQEKEKKDKALEDIVAIIKLRIPDLDGEKVTGLEGSIKKLLLFNEKGGNVDFVAPEADVDGSDAEPDDKDGTLTALVEARTEIHEYQSVREQIKMLTDMTDKG
jgi:hypothetical protein